jgi:hypothetical protein
MKLWGLNVGAFPQPALISQMQAANIQQLEVRTGYNGIHVLTNGQDLPYVKWDEPSVQTLQNILPKLPQVPNASTNASALPWLRTIGAGVLLDLPVAQGQTKLDIPRWNGEATVVPSTAVSPTLGPITIGSLAFDQNGQAVVEGIPAATLQKSLGMTLPTLDAGTMALLQSLGADKLLVQVHPNGVDPQLGDRPLPGVAWDKPRLDTLLADLPAFVSDTSLVNTLNQVVPMLNGAEVTLAVGLNGQPAAKTSISPISLDVSDKGDLSLSGIPLAPGAVPADALANLQKANVRQLAVSVQPTGITVAANGQTLPTVTWTTDTLPILEKVIGPMSGNPDLVSTMLPVALGLGPNVKVNLPAASGATTVTVPATVAAIQAVTSTADSPVITLTVSVDSNGNITKIGGFTADELKGLGVNLPAIPPDSLAALRTAGVKALTVDTTPGVLHLLLDGVDAVDIAYDQPSMLTTLDIATPFLGDSPVADPALNKLLRTTIIPLILTSKVNVAINME